MFKIIALAAAASALRLSACDCAKLANATANSGCAYSTECTGLTVNATFCCSGTALKSPVPTGCSGFSCA